VTIPWWSEAGAAGSDSELELENEMREVGAPASSLDLDRLLTPSAEYERSFNSRYSSLMVVACGYCTVLAVTFLVAI